MDTLPRTRFQARGAGDGARFETLVVGALLTAGLLTVVVASLVLGMARAPAKVLAIQLALARVLGVDYAFDSPRPDLVGVQIPRLTLPTPCLALLETAVHKLVTRFGASDGRWVLMASNLL